MNNLLSQIISSNRNVFFTLLAFVFLAYAWILPANFKTVDDYFCIVENSKIKDIKYLPEIFTTSFFGENSYYRPLVYTSFMAEYHFFKLNSFFYNLTNVLLHLGCGFAAFLIVARTVDDRLTAFIVSSLFIFHPIHWEAVTNIPGRSILLCAIFFLYAFYAFVEFSRRSKGGEWLYLLSIFLFIGALLSKESAAIFPMAALSFVLFKPVQVERKSIYRYILCYFVVFALYLFWRKHLGIVAGVRWDSFSMQLAGIVTFLKSCLDHLGILLIPQNLYFDRSYQLIFDWRVAVTILSIWIIVIVKYLFHYSKSRLINFYICWIGLNLAVVSQIVPVRISQFSISAADHFLYLSSIGFFVVLTILFRKGMEHLVSRRLITNQRFITLGVVGYFIFLLIITIGQNLYSREQIAMFNETLKYDSENSRVRLSLATAYAFIKHYDLAEDNYRIVLEANPYDGRARIGLGLALCDQGKCVEGLREYDRIGHAGILQELLEHNRKMAAKNLIRQYEKRLGEGNVVPGLNYSLAVMYARVGENEKAKESYFRELAINPQHQSTLFNLGALSAASGNKDEAKAYYNQLMELLQPNDPLFTMTQRELNNLQ